jgi:hypothetical protein
MNIARTLRTPTLLLAVIALLLAGLMLPAQAAAETGSVKGVVTLDGKPLKGVKVELFWTGGDGYTGPRVGVDTTNSKGAYSFKKVPIKNKKDTDANGKTILIKDPSHRIVNTSRTLRDRAGKTVTRNASVTKAASITGVVRRGDGVATSQLRTDVDGPFVLIDRHRELSEDIVYDTSVKVAKDGTFALRGLPAGDYYLEFVDQGKTYFPQCYDSLPATSDRTCDADQSAAAVPPATKITVVPGQDVTLNPQTLTTKGRRISGTVTDTSGRPIKHVRIRAADAQGKRLTTDTSKSGAFTVGPLTDGSYRLQVVPREPWAAPPADLQYDVNGADVSAGQIKLKSLASIKASLTSGKGTAKVAVAVTRSASGKKASGTVTIRWGTIAKTVTLVKGKATAKLSRLPKGKRTITVSYAGTSSTAPTARTFKTTVK